MEPAVHRAVHSRTRLDEAGASSQQWLVVEGARLPEGEALEALARELGEVYLSWIERLTAGIVRIDRRAPDGSARARVGPVGWPVGLELGPARVRGGRVSREVRGGWLVAEASGTLTVGVEPVPGGARAFVDLRGFRSRMVSTGGAGRWLYEKTQTVIHRRLSRAFLRHDVVPRLLGDGARLTRAGSLADHRAPGGVPCSVESSSTTAATPSRSARRARSSAS